MKIKKHILMFYLLFVSSE